MNRTGYRIGGGGSVNVSPRGRVIGDRLHRWASLALGLCAVLIAIAGVRTATHGSGSAGGGFLAEPAKPSARVTVAAGPAKVELPVPAATAPAEPANPAAPANPAGPAVPSLGPINPTVPVTVSVAEGRLREVRLIDGKSKQPVAGELQADGGSWRSTAPLAYGGRYQLSTVAVGDDNLEVRGSATVATLSPAKLAAVSFIPAPTAGVVGVGQPLVVKFSKPVTDKAAAERALKVTTSPEQPGGWYWFSATEAHYRSAKYWTAGTSISLSANMFGVDLGKGTFGQASRSMSVKIRDSIVAKADGSSHQMQFYRNGSLIKTMPVSLGSPKNPSHNGPHVVTTRELTRVMDSCTYGVCEGQAGHYRIKADLAVRISSSGEFVHSAPWSVAQQGRSNVSHGCINLSPANARWFFDNIGIGDVVEITNSGGPTLPLWDTYGDWTIPWAQWQTGSALEE
jgi:lipoprotein-anchoring transpeptidase ErfK/SrfK